MREKHNKKFISLLLCMMLIVAMACSAAGCGKQDGGNTSTGTQSAGVTVLGEGQTKFNFTVTDKNGNETAFEIHTDEETVGDALLALELIAGDMGDFGLYVKTVNGITADYSVDGTYWAFYINGEYAMSGVDMTPVQEGEAYAFKVEK